MYWVYPVCQAICVNCWLLVLPVMRRQSLQKNVLLPYQKYIGAYAAALGGVDIILFTGGVGENQMECRREVCKDMEFMGIELDNDVNAKVRGEEAIISTPASKVKVVVIPTDEELLIASDTMDILKK